VRIFRTPGGDTVADLGQNMVGFVRLRVKGPASTVVTLRHAEVLDKDGNFYTANLRRAKQEVTYTLKGGGLETYEPRFTFQGFRYVAVSGFPGELTADALTGVVVHSDLPVTGDFQTSSPLVNQLQKNIAWGQRGNFLDVPTDCPQRDERLGWTGDAQVFARTAAFNRDVASFFTKWLRDVAADQNENGSVPFVVPDVLSKPGKFEGGSAAWADAAVIIPWQMYLAYGDTRILETQYPSMKAWVEYMRKQAGESFLWNTGFHFGDWLAFATTASDYPGATTGKDLIAHRVLRLLHRPAPADRDRARQAGRREGIPRPVLSCPRRLPEGVRDRDRAGRREHADRVHPGPAVRPAAREPALPWPRADSRQR
jgi:alpha-L-rhamnosidase